MPSLSSIFLVLFHTPIFCDTKKKVLRCFERGCIGGLPGDWEIKAGKSPPGEPARSMWWLVTSSREGLMVLQFTPHHVCSGTLWGTVAVSSPGFTLPQSEDAQIIFCKVCKGTGKMLYAGLVFCPSSVEGDHFIALTLYIFSKSRLQHWWKLIFKQMMAYEFSYPWKIFYI